MCFKVALRPDPEGTIEIPMRPIGNPPPSPPRRHSKHYHSSSDLYRTEKRSPGASSHSRSTIPVKVVERSPKSSKHSFSSSRPHNSPRASRHSDFLIPPPDPVMSVPPAPSEPPIKIPEGRPYPVFIRQDGARPRFPDAPSVPGFDDSEDNSTVADDIVTVPRHPPRRGKSHRSKPPRARVGAGFESSDDETMESSSRGTNSSSDIPIPVPPMRTRPSTRPSTRKRNDTPTPSSPREPTRSDGQPKYHHRRSSYTRTQRYESEMGDPPSKASSKAPTSPRSSGPLGGEKEKPTLYLEDPAKRRSAQLAEEKILYGDDGRRRKQYHHR